MNFIEAIKEKYMKNKETFNFCLIVTFVLGLITHAYMFFQDSFSHDGLNELNADIFGNEWRIQLGRFAVPLYRALTRGNMSVPWLIGVISLLWIALSVYLTVKIFDIKTKPLIVLTAGIFATNVAVIATTATYIHDLDSNMFALFLSVCAVYLWKKYKFGFLVAIPIVTISLGMYQAYVSVTITLIIIHLILDLLKGSKFQDVFVKGIKGVTSLAVGGIIYFVLYKAILFLTEIPEVQGKYNTMDQLGSGGILGIIKTSVYVFKATLYAFFFPKNAISKNLVFILIVLSFVTAAIIICLKIFSKKIGILEKVLLLALVAVMPIGMGISGILSGNLGHDLMRFSDWLIFLFVLLLVYSVSDVNSENREKNKKGIWLFLSKAICIVTVVVILMGNVVSANEIYLKKELEQDSNLVFFTRVVDRMDCLEGYDRKTNRVVFVGRPDYYDENTAGFNNGYEIVGATGNYVLGAAGVGWYQRYFEYKLHYPITMVEATEVEEYSKKDFVKEMPTFPDEGCMQMVDDVLVVKLGEIKD